MGMALKADVTEAGRQTGTSKPIDLVHLAAQTMGEAALEREVLAIFRSQAENCLAIICANESFESRKQAAHLLKGSSRGIGAWDLAEKAVEAETPSFDDFDGLRKIAHSTFDYIKQLV